jgi:thiol:disulfide interchange protein
LLGSPFEKQARRNVTAAAFSCALLLIIQGPNCVLPLDPYTKLALGVIIPFLFVAELAVT